MRQSIQHNLSRFLRDTQGGTSAISLILITSIVALGAVVGLVTVRDQVTQEFGDVAVGLDRLNQSFHYTIEIDTDPMTPGFETTISAQYPDAANYPDAPSANMQDASGQPPACLMFAAPAGGEGSTPPQPPGTLP